MVEKAKVYCAGKHQRCPTQKNNNIIFNGPDYISRKGVTNKEASHPEYWLQYCLSSDGVLTDILDTLFQHWTAAAAASGSCNREVKMWELEQREINKNDTTKLTQLPVDTCEL